MSTSKDDRTKNLPPKVLAAIERYVEHLYGRGPGLDLEALDEGTLRVVEELLPTIAEAVLTAEDPPVPDDLPTWDHSRVKDALERVMG